MRDNSVKKKLDYLEILNRLKPMDDILMRRLFKDNIPLTELLLRIIMGKKDLKVMSVTTQSDIKHLTGIRSVTFDVDAVDSTGKRYDIEFQNESSGARPKRARYHSGVMDTESLKVRDDFEALPETYVIFITGKDYYGKGEAMYPIERVNMVTGESFNDESHILYVNGEYVGNSEIGKLLHDLRCSDPQEMYYELIKTKTEYCKTNEKEVKSMCMEMEQLRAEGVKEGTQETTAKFLKEMQAAGLTEELIKQIVNNIQSEIES